MLAVGGCREAMPPQAKVIADGREAVKEALKGIVRNDQRWRASR
jgi:hypothetical protein